MKFDFEQTGESGRLKLSGIIQDQDCVELTRIIENCTGNCRQLEIRLGRLSDISTSGLRVLAHEARRQRPQRCDIELSGKWAGLVSRIMKSGTS
jgi:ABC-type transporter Mla MlaB component